MIDMKLNSKRLGNHFHYYWWWYVVVILAGAFVANLLLTVTKPPIPDSQKVDISVYRTISDTAGEAWENDILRILPPDQKQVTISSTPALSGQDVAQVEQARLMGHEGMIYIVPQNVLDVSGRPTDYFSGMALDGAFMPLDDLLPQMNLPQDMGAADMKAQTMTVQSGEQTAQAHVYGIPLDRFKGLAELLGTDGMNGMVLAIPQYATDNLPNILTTVKWLLSKTAEPEANADPNRFTVAIASDYFGSTDTAAWKTSLGGKLNLASGVGFTLMPYHTGRQDIVAKDIAAARMGKPGICAVPRDAFVALARGGALLPLDDLLGKLHIAAGADLSWGRETAVTQDKTKTPGVEHLYGIPLDSCRGLTDVFNPSGMMLVIPAQSTEYLDADIAAANWMLEK